MKQPGYTWNTAPAVGRRRRAIASALAAAAVAVLGIDPVALAQPYPSKPIRVIVPYAAGGGVDIVTRTLAEGLTREFGHAVVVENRTGAGSNVGSTFVAKSDPDGYTLLMGSNANAVNNSLYANMQYDAAKELAPVVLVGRVPMVLLTGPNSAFKSVRDVVDRARAKPGSLNFGSGGAGTSEHLTSELFKRRADITAVHIPYRGGAAVYPDLISGQVDLLFNNQLQAMPFIQSGQVRALGIASATRSAQLPNVPTLVEQGVPEFYSGAWWGIMGPGGLPSDIVRQLNQMLNTVIASPAVAKRLESLGAERGGGTPEQFRDFFRGEMATWSEIIKAEKIRAE